MRRERVFLLSLQVLLAACADSSAQQVADQHMSRIGCQGERLDHPGTLEVCRGVATAFEGGDTYLTEMLGVAIAKRVWPEQSPEWKAATEARRVYDYRAALGERIPVDFSSEQSAKNYLALCARNHREQDVYRARLVAAGEDPNPPRE